MREGDDEGRATAAGGGSCFEGSLCFRSEMKSEEGFRSVDV